MNKLRKTIIAILDGENFGKTEDETVTALLALFNSNLKEQREGMIREVEDEFERLLFNLSPNNSTMQFVRDFRSFLNELKGIKDEK